MSHSPRSHSSRRSKVKTKSKLRNEIKFIEPERSPIRKLKRLDHAEVRAKHLKVLGIPNRRNVTVQDIYNAVFYKFRENPRDYIKYTKALEVLVSKGKLRYVERVGSAIQEIADQ